MDEDSTTATPAHPAAASPVIADMADRYRCSRDRAVRAGDMGTALTCDDILEGLGMHADDRATCHGCQSWGDHAHHRITGARMTLADYDTRYGTTTAAEWAAGFGALIGAVR